MGLQAVSVAWLGVLTGVASISRPRWEGVAASVRGWRFGADLRAFSVLGGHMPVWRCRRCRVHTRKGSLFAVRSPRPSGPGGVVGAEGALREDEVEVSRLPRSPHSTTPYAPQHTSGAGRRH
jgi:hypothetical protein